MLSIVVLAYHLYKSDEMTRDCLASIDAQDLSNISHDKTLVDNGSQPKLPPYYGWHIVRLPENVGNIQGQNECFNHTPRSWVLFLSNDVILGENCIKKLWEVRDLKQMMPKILNMNGTVQSLGGRITWPGYGLNQLKEGRLDYVPSIVYLMPRSLWRKVGGFDASYPMAYEDVDMGHRLGSERLICIPEAEAYHRGNATLKYTNNLPFRLGRRKFIRKHYGGIDKCLRLSTESLLNASSVLGSRLGI